MTAAPWLFVDGASSFGGHQVMLTRWVEELAAQGRVRPRLLARAGSVLRQRGAAHATGAALPERAGPPVGIWARLVAAWRDARVIWRTIREVSPAVVVVAEGSPLSQPLPALVCRAARARLLVYLPLTQPTTEMGFRSGPIRDAVMKLGFAAVPHAWVVLTEDQAAAFARWTGARRPVFVLPNTVAREIEGRFAHESTTAGAVAGPLRVVVLGRLDIRQKGLDLLLDCLEQPGTPGPEIAIALVGDGPDGKALAVRIAGSPRLSATVRMAPWSDPIAALETSDVLLLPSRYEGVPLVMLEAMALGIPVVASDLPGTRGFLPPECRFAVGDLDRAFGILRWLADPEARRRIAAANRRTFAAKASGAAFASAVQALAEQFGGSPGRPITATGI